MRGDADEFLSFFLSLSVTLAAQRSRDELYAVVAAQARHLIGARRSELLTLDHTNQHLVMMASDPLPGARPAPIPLYEGTGRNMSRVAAQAAFSGRIVAVPDVYGFSMFDLSDLHVRDQRDGWRTRSTLAFPLRNHEGMTIGVIQAFDIEDAGSTPETVLPDGLQRFVLSFAPMAAVAMTNMRLLDEKQSLIRRLGRSNDNLEEENARLRSHVSQKTTFAEVIGDSPAMQDAFKLVRRTLDSKVTVLLNGETGTGKEVMAHAIHRNSIRRDGPFIVQNCAALPEQLLESELFGHRRGAFTGATENKTGLFQAADRGTLFLDEIGDMPLTLQGKILRVLQDSEVRPIGETRGRKVDVRIIAATHRDLREHVRAGLFREDLFYRICVFPIVLPALRERVSDILPLANHLVAQFAAQMGRARPRISTEAAELLERHPFPGNVRELKNVVERALLLLDGGEVIGPQHLPTELQRLGYVHEYVLPGPTPPDAGDLREILQRYEAIVISSWLDNHGWNQTLTARALNISRRSLVEKIQRYAIRRPAPHEA